MEFKENETKPMTFKEAADSYEKPKTLNIADLESFDVSEPIEGRKGTDKEGKEFKYNVLIRDSKEYRVPNKVLSECKNIMAANAKHGKTINTFAVEKAGEGLATQYTVVAL